MGIIGQLAWLFCRSGCRATSIASALAFHPPNPSNYGLTGRGTEDDPYKMVLSPDVAEYINPSIATTDVIVTKSKSRIVVVLFTVPNAAYTVIISHGNAADLGVMFPVLAQISMTLGVNVVGYDYSGYGVCTGTPTDRQTYQDIDAVFDWCMANVPGNAKIVLYGQSVGSGPSCYLATNKRKNIIAGLILHSPILSGVRVLSESRGVLACFDIFPNIDRIQHVRCPVFILHGEEDIEVPLAHGTGLQNAVPKEYQTPPWWVPKRGHNDLTLGYESEYFRRLSLFLSSISNSAKEAATLDVNLQRSSRSITSSKKDNPMEAPAVVADTTGTRELVVSNGISPSRHPAVIL